MAFCRYLDGEDVPSPFAFWLGRLCEEFPGKTPSEMYLEWLTAPAGLLEEIILYRSFQRAKDVYDNAKTKADVPRTPMVQRVMEVEFAIVNEDRQRREAQVDGITADN